MSRQLIDGVWHNGKTSDRESGDVMLAVMKVLSNLDMAERRKKQEGKFGAKYNDHKYVVPDRQPGREDGRARDASTCWAASGPRSRRTKTWACGRSWPSNGREQMARDKGLVIISGLAGRGHHHADRRLA